MKYKMVIGKSILTFLILSSICSRVCAHVDFEIQINKEKVHVAYMTGWGQLAINDKANILADLANRLIKRKYPGAEKLFIDFKHNYTKADSGYYAVGYGNFSYWDYKNEPHSPDIKAVGIKLIIRDRDLNIPQLLNLINTAYSQIPFIKINQSLQVVSSIYGGNDTLQSIPFTLVNQYKHKADSLVKKLLTEKVFVENKRDDQENFGWYYQHNLFNFYARRSDQKVNPILTVPNLHEIAGSDQDGYFIFTNDSVFHFIKYGGKIISGPYIIHGIWPGRPPLKKYNHDYDPFERFILFFDNYADTANRVLFVPDSNKVINDYANREKKFLQSLFEKEKVPAQNKKPLPFIIVTTLLILSIILNGWLLWKKRK